MDVVEDALPALTCHLCLADLDLVRPRLPCGRRQDEMLPTRSYLLQHVETVEVAIMQQRIAVC
jgi:hypothetical protein